MNWHLQPSGYVLLWALAFCSYALFWLYKIELDRYRAVIGLVLIGVMALVITVAIRSR